MNVIIYAAVFLAAIIGSLILAYIDIKQRRK